MVTLITSLFSTWRQPVTYTTSPEGEPGRHMVIDIYVLVDLWPRRRCCMTPGRKSSNNMARVGAMHTRPPCGVLQCTAMLMHDILASVRGSCRHLHDILLASEPSVQFTIPLLTT